MLDYFEQLKEFFTPRVLAWTSGTSLLLMVVTLFVSGVLLVRLPADYFVKAQDLRPETALIQPRWLTLVLSVLRNIIGFTLLVAGIIMLVLPGQGVITIIAALLLLDFPGKFKLIGKLVASPKVQSGMNHIRKKFGKQAFTFVQTPKA